VVAVARTKRLPSACPKHGADVRRLKLALEEFSAYSHPLPGIEDPACRDSLLEQILESLHRVRYIARIRERDISPLRADPASDRFDPIKAAAFYGARGCHDEACWVTFLSVHFGRNRFSGWQLARDIYGRLGRGRWDWDRVSRDPASFRRWLATNESRLGNPDRQRGFGNHRQYQSLDAHSPAGTGSAIVSYVNWVSPPGSHRQLFEAVAGASGGDPRETFDSLYRSLESVASFGRLAKFDYLTMLGKLGLAPIEPKYAYIADATGPLRGARLLFTGTREPNGTRPARLEEWLGELDERLQVGMQVLEDAMCNWQKSPRAFQPFRG
jgi:hypothetical protein